MKTFTTTFLNTLLLLYFFLLTHQEVCGQMDFTENVNYQIVFDTGKALDTGNSYGKDMPVRQWDSDINNPNQMWRFKLVPNNPELFYVISVKTGKYLQIRNTGDESKWDDNGLVIVLDDFNGLKLQQWRLLKAFKGSRSILQNGESYKMMEVSGKEKTKNGGKIQQWSVNRNDNQRIQLIKTPLPPNTSSNTRPNEVPAINTWYYIQFKHSGKVLDNTGRLENGVQSVQWGMAPNDNQAWKLVPVVAGKNDFFIVNKKSGKVLEVGHAGMEVGRKILQYDNLKGDHQIWELKYAKDNCFKIKNKKSQKFLNVSAASQNDGAKMVQWDEGGTNQDVKFILHAPNTLSSTPSTGVPLPDTWYYIQFKHSGKVLDNTGRLENSVQSIQWGMAPNDNQAWKLVRAEAGKDEFFIISKRSGKVLEVSHAAMEAGKEILQYDNLKGDHQIWQLAHAEDNHFKIKNKKSQKYLDVFNYSQDDGGKMIQWDAGGTNQDVKFIPHTTNDQIFGKSSVSYPEKATWYYLQFEHSGKVLDSKGSSNDGVTVIQSDIERNKDSQAWKLVYADNKHFFLFNKGNGKVLEVPSGKKDSGVEITTVKQMVEIIGNNLFNKRYQNYQQWSLEKVISLTNNGQPIKSNYFQLPNRLTNKYLDVFGIKKEAGTKIIQWDRGGGNQYVRFIPFE